MLFFDAIDVFSGTGGISLALKDYVDTIQYCEVNPYCQQVLTERMQEGRLHRAPIHSDITTLHISSKVRPNMIMGGFPCQDISSMGLQQGIQTGTRSGLFHEIVRLIDECPTIQFVFLENVGNILKCGIQEVVNELAVKRGFNLQWTIRSASSFGAPHMRNRWFCLAVRGDPGPVFEQMAQASIALEQNEANIWTTPPDRLYVHKPAVQEDQAYDPNWSLRCQCMGNAVVPHVVRYAFVELMRSCSGWSSIAKCLEQCACPDIEGVAFPESALVYDGKLYAIPKAFHRDVKHGLDITVMLNGKPVKMPHLPTPRRGITHASTLNDRSMRDLPTVILNSEACRAQMTAAGISLEEGPVHTRFYVNPHFIEWMMGYEPDWTKIKGAYKSRGGGSRGGAKGSSTDDDVDGGGSNEGGDDEGEAAIAPAVTGRGRRSTAATTTAGNSRPSRRGAVNGLHILMREHPGKHIVEVNKIWRSMTDEQKDVYRQRAKDATTTSAATVAVSEDPTAAVAACPQQAE